MAVLTDAGLVNTVANKIKGYFDSPDHEHKVIVLRTLETMLDLPRTPDSTNQIMGMITRLRRELAKRGATLQEREMVNRFLTNCVLFSGMNPAARELFRNLTIEVGRSLGLPEQTLEPEPELPHFIISTHGPREP